MGVHNESLMNHSCLHKTQLLPSHKPQEITPAQTKLPTIPHQPTLWNFVQKKLPNPPTDTQPQTMTDSTLPTLITQPALLQTQREQVPKPIPPKTQHQTMLNTLPCNKPWGNAWVYTQPHNAFQVLSKNISMINPYLLDMIAIMMELDAQNASIFLAQETNTPWKPATLHAIQSQCQCIYCHSKISTSFSKDSTKNTYQLGGTLLLALGKWVSWVVSCGTDETLGHWAYLEFVGKHGMCLIVVSAYCVCSQQFDATTITATAQQMRLLLQQGIPNPDPKKTIYYWPDFTSPKVASAGCQSPHWYGCKWRCGQSTLQNCSTILGNRSGGSTSPLLPSHTKTSDTSMR